MDHPALGYLALYITKADPDYLIGNCQLYFLSADAYTVLLAGCS